MLERLLTRDECWFPDFKEKGTGMPRGFQDIAAIDFAAIVGRLRNDAWRGHGLRSDWARRDAIFFGFGNPFVRGPAADPHLGLGISG